VLARRLPLALALALVPLACDSGDKPDPAAEAKAKEAEEEAKLEEDRAKRRAARAAKEEEEKRVQEEIAAKIQKNTVIPEGTKIPKKIADACKQLVAAQSDFMKKFFPQVDEAALAGQLSMIEKQCLETDIEVVMCQKFAIEATDEQLKSMINEYLPTCMGKYGEAAAAAGAPPAGP
jgi:aminopeptidase N